MFHHFHGPGHAPSQGSISANDLGRMIEFYGARRFVPARTFVERAPRGGGRRTDLCLTFDDNLRCQYDVAKPILDFFGITAFWFIYTGPFDGQFDQLEIYRTFRTQRFESVESFYAAFENMLPTGIQSRLAGFELNDYLAEFPFYTSADRRFRFIRDELLGPERYHELMDQMLTEHGFDVRDCARSLWMTPAMIRELHEGGHVIGMHSHTHPTRLERLDATDQQREYQANFEQICQITGEEPVAMSHPCNSYNDATLGILRNMGMKVGFRANIARPDSRELEWPREDHANVMKRMKAAA